MTPDDRPWPFVWYAPCNSRCYSTNTRWNLHLCTRRSSHAARRVWRGAFRGTYVRCRDTPRRWLLLLLLLAIQIDAQLRNACHEGRRVMHMERCDASLVCGLFNYYYLIYLKVNVTRALLIARSRSRETKDFCAFLIMLCQMLARHGRTRTEPAPFLSYRRSFALSLIS